jgi:hypothetical protein
MIVWRMAVSEKWHAYREGEERSVCTLAYAGSAVADAVDDQTLAVQRCYWCRRELGMPVKPSKHTPPRRQTSHEPEEFQAEFVAGGRLDGKRLTLFVVWEDPHTFRVLEGGYRVVQQPPAVQREESSSPS